METVQTAIFEEPPINEREILRYMSSRGGEDELRPLISECLDELRGRLSYKVCHITLPIEIDGNKIKLPCGEIESHNLAKNLSGCEKAVIFAAPIGVEIDRLIAKYSRLSPAKAFCCQAIGAERVEIHILNRHIVEIIATVEAFIFEGLLIEAIEATAHQVIHLIVGVDHVLRFGSHKRGKHLPLGSPGAGGSHSCYQK